jgi:hypothetical protein
MNAVYVFALADRITPPFTIGGHRLEFLDVGGVYAAIERCTDRPPISEAALHGQHAVVLALSERLDAVLPARFGAWLDPGELKDLVANQVGDIREALDLVRGRVQMTIRFPAVSSAGEEAATAAASGTDYLERRRQASRRVPAVAKQVSEAVRHLVVAERTAPGNRTGPAIYHLIERGRIADYLAIASAGLPSGATVTGPWPAFAFTPELWP